MSVARKMVSLSALLMAFAVLAAGAASGATASGCSFSISTYDSDGLLVDTAVGPGPGGTESNPLAIDPDGRIDWSGSTATVITDATWQAEALGLSRSGEFANSEQATSKSGSIALGDENLWLSLPMKFLLSGDAKMLATGSVTGSGGSCSGSVWITGVSSPEFSPMWWTALVLLLIGVAILLTAMFGSTTTGEVVAVTGELVDAGALEDYGLKGEAK